MRALRNIIDTWNMIEKYQIKGYEVEKGVVNIHDAEYERLLAEVKNKQYIKNLLR